MIKIKFGRENYETLIKLVYLGNWLVNSIRTDDMVEKYEKIEEYIFSLAEKIGLGKYVHFDNRLKKYFPSKELEDLDEINRYIDQYDNQLFWDELAERLAMRDFEREYPQDKLRKEELKERWLKQERLIEKYESEFQKNGLRNVELKKLCKK